MCPAPLAFNAGVGIHPSAESALYVSGANTGIDADNANMLRLKAVVADIEVDTLIRVLQIFQDGNLSPRKVSAQRLHLRSQDREVVHIEFEFAISDLTLDTLRLIAAKIAQMPITLSTVFCQDPTQPSQGGVQTLVIPTIPPNNNS